MKHVIATLIGFLSGFMLYMATAITFSAKSGEVPTIAWISFLAGWGFTHYFCVKNTTKSLKVLSRGLLIGCLEWVLMIFAGFIMSSRAVVETTANSSSSAESAGAAIGGGLAAMFTGAFSGIMAAVCFFLFLVTYFLSKEFKEDNSEKSIDCPECAEPINAKAKKCKHCGSSLNINVDEGAA